MPDVVWKTGHLVFCTLLQLTKASGRQWQFLEIPERLVTFFAYGGMGAIRTTY